MTDTDAIQQARAIVIDSHETPRALGRASCDEIRRLPAIPPRGSDFATWRAYFDALAVAHGRPPLELMNGGAK